MRQVLAISILASLIACTQAPLPPPVAGDNPADSADQVISGFQTETVSDLSGIRLSLVRGDSAWFYQSDQRYVIKNITVIFPDSNGKTISTITARIGVYRSGDQSLDARDSVVGITPDGRELRTEHLLWDPRQNEISSDTSFVLTSPGEPPMLKGSSFVATPDFRNLRINEASGKLTREQPARKAPSGKAAGKSRPGATKPAPDSLPRGGA